MLNSGTPPPNPPLPQAIFAPSRAPSSSGSSPKARPQPNRTLAALPSSLPHLSLLVKLTAGSDPAGLSPEAWSQAGPCIDKLTGAQLRSWMDFLLLQGRQPLPVGAAGKLTPLDVGPALR